MDFGWSVIYDLSDDRRINAVIDDNILPQSYMRQKGFFGRRLH